MCALTSALSGSCRSERRLHFFQRKELIQISVSRPSCLLFSHRGKCLITVYTGNLGQIPPSAPPTPLLGSSHRGDSLVSNLSQAWAVGSAVGTVHPKLPFPKMPDRSAPNGRTKDSMRRTESRFLRHLRSELTRSLITVKSELGPN